MRFELITDVIRAGSRPVFSNVHATKVGQNKLPKSTAAWFTKERLTRVELMYSTPAVAYGPS